MKTILLIGLGGFAGAVGRYGLTSLLGNWKPSSSFPWGILAANLLGCFLIGVVLALSERTALITENMRWLLVTGFLGSLTTFSTFGVDTINLLRSHQPGLALANVGGSVVLGLIAVYLGFLLTGGART